MSKTERWFAPDKWNLSPFLWNSEIRDKMSLPKRFTVRDTGVRHQGDHPHISPSVEDRLKMVEVLVELGVTEIECGWPATVRDDYDLIKGITKAGLNISKSAMVGVHADDVKKEMDVAVEAGADNFKIANVPCTKWSEPDLRPYKKGVNREEAIAKSLVMAEHAKTYGLPISTGYVDIMRADLEWIRYAWNKFRPGDIARFFLYEDGQATPASMRYFITQLKQILGQTPILVHCHNTFGLGTANVLAAVEVGAEWADLSLNGYGPESGVASLEEVVCALEILYRVDTGINLEKLYDASKIFEKITGVRCHAHKPIVGENIFLTKNGKAAAKTLKAKGKWEPEIFPFDAFNPKLVGQSHGVVWEIGPRTVEDPEALRLKLADLGIKCSDEEFEKLAGELAKQIRLRRWVDDDEFSRLVLKYASEMRLG